MDDLTDPKPQSGCLIKTVGLLLLSSIIVGAAVYWGIKYTKTLIPKNPPAAPALPTPQQTPEIVATPAEPPALVIARQLTTADQLTRKNLVTQLAVMEGSKSEAVNFLSASLPQAAPEIKIDIVAALGLLAKKNPEAIPALVSALDDKTIRQEAIPALGSLGPAGAAAVPKLKKIVQSKKEGKSIKAVARKALNQIRGKNQGKKSVSGAKRRAQGGKKK